MKNDEETEKMIQAKGLNAPRLNPQMIEDTIEEEYYHVFPGTSMTVCMLILKNGFKVTGESSSVSLENFDEALGQKIARENAKQKIWMLEGYLLKQRLFAGEETSEPVKKASLVLRVDLESTYSHEHMEEILLVNLTFDSDETKRYIVSLFDSTKKQNLTNNHIIRRIKGVTGDEALNYLSALGVVSEE